MKRTTRVLAWGTAALALAAGLVYVFGGWPLPGMLAGPTVRPNNFSLSGPYTHDNLTVYLIHGAAQLPDASFLTLHEALEQQKVIVHETENVGQLQVENVSASEEVLIRAGDIVKGGKQDRTIEYDLIVPPQSGKVPLASLCVESGRWKKRGYESISSFSSSSNALSTRELKLAAMYRKNQGEVWRNVEQTQERLASNVSGGVRAAESASSLQLTLESPAVQEAVAPYRGALGGIIDSKADVVGYAFAINGRLNSAEAYAAPTLFRKLWPKLLDASAIEAVAAREPDAAAAPVTEEAVRAFLADAERGNTVQKAVTERVELIMQESGQNLLFETRDRQRPGVWVHRTYLSK